MSETITIMDNGHAVFLQEKHGVMYCGCDERYLDYRGSMQSSSVILTYCGCKKCGKNWIKKTEALYDY